MFIVIDWVLMSLLVGLFLLVYFTDIRIKSMQAYSNLRINQHVEYVVDGILYGCLFLLFYFLFSDLSFGQHIFLVAGVLLMLTKDYRVSLIGLISPLITEVATGTIDEPLFITIALVYSFIMVQVIVSHYVDFPYERRISLSFLFSITTILVIAFSVVWSNPGKSFSVIMWPVVIILYSYFIVSYAIRTSESANALYKTINYTFSNYYRNTMKERAILENISQHKYSYGIYCLLDIEIKDAQSKQEKNEIFESVLLDLENIVPSSTLLFKSTENYGFFLPRENLKNLSVMINGNHNLKRTDVDPLLLIQKIVESIPDSYKTTTSSVNKVKASAGVALYGLQNQSILELDTMAEYALKVSNTKRDNIVTLFEPKSYMKRINDSEELKNLNTRIGLDNFDIDYRNIYSTATRQQRYTLSKQRLISDTLIIPSLDEYKVFHKATKTFDRYFAASAIKKYDSFDKSPLIIRYSPTILNQEFNIGEFMVFIDRHEIEPSNLILEFLDSDLKKVSDIKALFDNIKQLKLYGIKIAVLITTGNRTSMIQKIDPTLLLFHNLRSIEENSNTLPHIQKVVMNIETEIQLNLARSHGVDYFSGTLIETNR